MAAWESSNGPIGEAFYMLNPCHHETLASVVEYNVSRSCKWSIVCGANYYTRNTSCIICNAVLSYNSRANYDALILRKLLRLQYFAPCICKKVYVCRANYNSVKISNDCSASLLMCAMSLKLFCKYMTKNIVHILV